MGFENSGFEGIFSIDNDKYCKMSFDINFNISQILDDICTINIAGIPKCDVLTAGFPCQPFSIAGLRKGLEDPRTKPLMRMFDIIDYVGPKCVFIENVSGLVNHNNGKTLKFLLSKLRNSCASVFWKTLNTTVYTSIPQNRNRLFIIGFKENITNWSWPEKVSEQFPWKSFLEQPEILDTKYFYTQTSKIYNRLIPIIGEPKLIYQYRRGILRKNMSNQCPTLVASMGSGGHNVPIIYDDQINIIRKLTPRECFNFQGFPRSYRFPEIRRFDMHLYKQIGNSVTVPLVERLAKRIFNLV